VDVNAMKDYICQAWEGIDVIENSGDFFFNYDPDGDLRDDRWLPFATIVTNDNDYDTVSRLSRPNTYRLNIGLTKATYTSLFGTPPTQHDEHGVLDTGFDYATTDQVMPHPTYAGQHWVCVVNPSDATIDALQPLLAEAYEFAKRKHANHKARSTRS
jgi:hypothetical protein